MPADPDPPRTGAPPSGVVAFLFTDVEGSTAAWAADESAMSASLQVHDAILRSVIDDHRGYVFSTAGDSFSATFARVSDAVGAAAAAQEALTAADWGSGPNLRVRMGIHLGEAEERGGDYFGTTVNTAARVGDAGHGGQVLLTSVAREAAGADVVGVDRDLGAHALRGVDGEVRLFQIGDTSFPPLRTATSGIVSLPTPRTSLVGRDDSLIAIRKLVADHRLVTLTGVGGCGKTRLAIETAALEAPSRPDGVWFVDLASVADDEAVPGAFAAALDMATDSGVSTAAQITDYLAGRRALLVVDNCEHLLDAVADLLEEILDGAPDLHVLATSREGLEVEGEQTWRVPSLDVGVDGPAVRLFEERAASVDQAFTPDDDTRRVMAEICERLDGIPLAVELAAARVRSMEVTEIRDRLDDRFRLLSGGRRRSRQRQQTLEAAVRWSFDLLPPDEQSALCRLAVFQGGFDLVDVGPVLDLERHEAVDVVDALVAKSLIDVIRSDDGPIRHRLLETVRLFALERLIERGEAAATRHRHLAHFVADPVIHDWGLYALVAGALRVETELENFRAAASWAREEGRDADTAVLAAGLADRLMFRSESRQLIEWLSGVDHLEGPSEVRRRWLLSHVHTERFEFDAAIAAGEAGVSYADGEPLNGLSGCHWTLAKLHMVLGEHDRVGEHLDRALAAAAESPSPDMQISVTLLYRAAFEMVQTEFADAVDSAEEALAIAPPDFIFRQVTIDFRDLATLYGGGVPERASVPGRSGPGLSVYDHLTDIASALTLYHATGSAAAGAALADAAAHVADRRPLTVGDWTVAFGLLEAWHGDLDRARYVTQHSLGLTMPGCRDAVGLLLTEAGQPNLVSRLDAADSVAVDQRTVLAEEIARWS